MFAPALQRLANDFLGFPDAVDIGRVDEIDTEVQSLVDDPDTIVMIGIEVAAEHHCAEAKGADLDAGSAEGAVLHKSLPYMTALPHPHERGIECKRNIFRLLNGTCSGCQEDL
nr:hypothetical protein [Sphingobium sp. SJ10-10]